MMRNELFDQADRELKAQAIQPKTRRLVATGLIDKRAAAMPPMTHLTCPPTKQCA